MRQRPAEEDAAGRLRHYTHFESSLGASGPTVDTGCEGYSMLVLALHRTYVA